MIWQIIISPTHGSSRACCKNKILEFSLVWRIPVLSDERIFLPLWGETDFFQWVKLKLIFVSLLIKTGTRLLTEDRSLPAAKTVNLSSLVAPSSRHWHVRRAHDSLLAILGSRQSPLSCCRNL